MGRNIQLLKKRVFRWVMAIAWKTLNEQRVHIAGSTLALWASSFPLVPMHPCKMCLETPRHIFMLPITDFGSCNTYFGNHPSFLRKKMNQPKGK
jgi:hypothetical protein